MCDDRELGFEIKPGYISRLSLAQIMYLRKTCPGIILRIPAKKIYHYDRDESSSSNNHLQPDVIDFMKRQISYEEMEEDEVYNDYISE